MTEKELQRQVLDWLRIKRIFHWRNNSGAMTSSYKGKSRFMRFGAIGSPDIFAVCGGWIYGFEIKGPKGKLSPEQVKFGIALEKAGGRYQVVRSLEDVTFYFTD